MIDTPGLRIIFGVTGHRDIPSKDVPLLEETVRKIFVNFRHRYPNTTFVLLSPLAAGADRLVARIALENGVRVRVPMPLEENEYRKDFDPAEDAEFVRMLAHAEESYAIDLAAGNNEENVVEAERRAIQYQMVGEYIARLSHVLLALWDGQPATSIGGTASIVAYRLSGSRSIPKDAAQLLDIPVRGAIYHIFTKRQSQPQPDVPIGTLIVRTRKKRLEAEDDPFCPLYERIERFNKDIVEYGPIPEADCTINGMRVVTEKLATAYQQRYFWALRVLFILATVAAISLATAHGEPPLYPLVIGYFILLCLSYLTYGIADTGQWKSRSIEYRALEIGLSIQQLWDRVGLAESAANAYLRIQWSECDWIRQAVQSIHFLSPTIDADPNNAIDVTRSFIEDQRAFFAGARIRDENRAQKYARLAALAVAVGLGLTIVLLLIGQSNLSIAMSFFGYYDPPKPFNAANLCIRGIIICTILAAVFHEYPRRRAFEAQARRYTAMRPIYGRAIDMIEAASALKHPESLDVARDIAEQIGKEALAENGEWLLMHRDLPLDPLHV